MYGKELAGTDNGTGYQDAISPPWQTNFSLVFYIAAPAILGIFWWQLGFIMALAAAVAIFVGLVIVRMLLPRPESNHFKLLILRSMSNRYANFVREGDTVRADAMKSLLVTAGVQPDATTGT